MSHADEMDALSGRSEPALPGTLAEALLERLHERYRVQLYGYLVKLTLGDTRMAEDIVQETFVRAWRQIGRDPGIEVETFAGWLYTVARRLVVDMLRARRARPSEVIVDDLSQVSAAQDPIGGLVAAHAVRDALRTLSLDHRVVLIELYYHGRSPTEVADLLDIPVGTVSRGLTTPSRPFAPPWSCKPRDLADLEELPTLAGFGAAASAPHCWISAPSARLPPRTSNRV